MSAFRAVRTRAGTNARDRVSLLTRLRRWRAGQDSNLRPED